MPSTHSSRLRSVSVSSILSTNVPPDWRATTQLNSAARALPDVEEAGWRRGEADPRGVPGHAGGYSSSTMVMAPVGQPLAA